jgi:uncharacterized protein YicC (UPF0701 family)
MPEVHTLVPTSEPTFLEEPETAAEIAARKYEEMVLHRGVVQAALEEHMKNREKYGHVADAFKMTAMDHLAEMRKQDGLAITKPATDRLADMRKKERLSIQRTEEAKMNQIDEPEAKYLFTPAPNSRLSSRPSHSFAKAIARNSRAKHHHIPA